MLKRTITAVCIATVLIPLLLVGQSTVFFPLLFTFISVVAEFELLRCLGLQKNIPISIVLYLAAGVAPFAARYIRHEMFQSGALAVLGLILLVILTVFTFSKGKVTLEQACAAGTVGIYIILAFMSIVILSDRRAGNFVCLLIFIGAWSTDVFAYLCGRLFGKHKLIPAISPKKTIEGALGGIFFCVAAFIVYACVIERYADVHPDYLVFAVGGVFTSLVSQAGDLIMSAIKRSKGIKDFGKILPGHGGILDRFDSVMAVSLILLFIESFFGLMT